MHLKEKALTFLHGHKKIIAISAIAATLISLLLIQTIRATIARKNITVSPTIKPSPTPTPFKDWQTYENNKRGFTVLVPPTWIIDEIIGRAIFTPKDDKPTLGSITEVTITIINNPAKDQPLTSEKEFNEWLAKDLRKEVPEKGRLYKLDNLKVAGFQSVTLVDLGRLGEQDSDDWSLVTWFRKDEENYYINAKGNKKLSNEDIRAYNYLLSSFQFE